MSLNSHGPYRAVIRTLKGKEVKSFNWDGLSVEVPIDNFSGGFYLLEIESKTGTSNQVFLSP